MRRIHSSFGLFNTVVISLFSLFTICNLFQPKESYSRLENRYLQTFPSFTLEALQNRSFMKDFETYINDQLFARDFFVMKKASLEVMSGKKENNGVYLCKSDYLIEKLPEWDETTVNQNLKAVKDLDALGNYRITLAVVPPAYEILREKLPANVYQPLIPKLNKTIQTELANTNVQNADPTKLLWEHRREYLYYRTDHHQTSKGSRLVYKQLAGPLGYEPLGDASFNPIDISHDFLGTTFSKALVPVKPDTITEYRTTGQNEFQVRFPDEDQQSDSLYFPEHLKEKDQYSFFLDGNHGLSVIDSSNKNGRQLAIFKDSYAHSIAPFLANHFETIHMIDLRYYQGDVLQYLTEHQIEDVLFLYSVSSFLSDQTLQKVSDCVNTSPYAKQKYGKVEEGEPVDNSYFSDAVFVGDSLTVGFQMYTGLTEADFLCSTGMSINGLESVQAPGGGTYLDQLKQGEYKKIYIMLGINESVTLSNKEAFIEKYSDLIDTIKTAHPRAYIYLQSMLPVSRERNQEGTLQNEVIQEFNAALESMAQEKKIYYIDVYNAVADEYGFLPDDCTSDGVHLQKESYLKWLDYLKTHAIADPSAQTVSTKPEQFTISDYDVSNIAGQLKDSLEFQDRLGEISPAMLCQTHGIDPDRIANAAGWISGGATAEEIAVFEANSKKEVSYIKEQLEQYLKSRIKSYESYLPAEVPKLKHAFVLTQDKLAIIIVADDHSQAKEIIQKEIK